MELDAREKDLFDSIAAVQRLSAVPDILNVVNASTGLGFAAVARVTNDDWVACAVRDDEGFGLSVGGRLAIETTLCETVRRESAPVIIDDVTSDARFGGHPTLTSFGVCSYISVPINSANEFFGTLCGFSRSPVVVSVEKTTELFRLFANVIGQQLAQEREQRQRLAEAEAQAELREQFIAVLGHDLRGPLAAIKMSAFALQQSQREPRDQRALQRIERSSNRIAGLVDDVMDLARARLGGGLEFARADVDVKALVERLVEERAAIHSDRRIAVAAAGPGPFAVVGHEGRLGQVVANLVGNAIEHSSNTARVTVTVARELADVVVAVHNEGSKMDDAALPTLFQPFFRGRSPGNREGLGLGLYIAAQIVAAHGGSIAATSDSDGTTFTFRLPLDTASSPTADQAS